MCILHVFLEWNLVSYLNKFGMTSVTLEHLKVIAITIDQSLYGLNPLLLYLLFGHVTWYLIFPKPLQRRDC